MSELQNEALPNLHTLKIPTTVLTNFVSKDMKIATVQPSIKKQWFQSIEGKR